MSTGEVPDYLVERLSLGDLPPDEARRVQARLEARGELDRIEKLRTADGAFLAEHPVRPMVVALEARRGPRDLAARRPVIAVTGAAALVATGAVLFAMQGERSAHVETDPVASGGSPGERVKGEHAPRWIVKKSEIAADLRGKSSRAWLGVYRKTAGEPARLRDQSPVRAGDTVQLSYMALGAKYGVIASVDALGTVTLHMPDEAGSAVQLTDMGLVENAFELDASPGFEKFVFVTSDKQFTTADVASSLLTGEAHRPLPPHLEIFDLTLTKERP